MISTSFLEKLLLKLKQGDARSIHLNALPGNFGRLDIYDLINIEQSLHLKFLENLLTKKEFKFSITIDQNTIQNKTNEEKKIIQKTIKKLNHINFREKEEFAEHGYHSFAFGYPLLIKRDSNSNKILKAPLLIWYLKLERDTRKNNTWTISREEDAPLIINELLQANLEKNEKIKTEDLEVFIEDDFINEAQLQQLCKTILEKLNATFDTQESIATILPCTNKETIENITQETSWIRWSGVMGLYKMQKQSIIKDVENLIEKNENETIQEIENYDNSDDEILTPIVLDPSQENVLYQLQNQQQIVIQGPPGTGKSQSLSALITQALINKKKVLVVCEKRTAMEVLYNNLKEENLHHLCVLIEDVYSDRKNIVEKVRQKIEEETETTIRFRANEHELLRTQFLTLQEEINHQINFCNTIIFGDDNWAELLCKSIILNKDKTTLQQANEFNKFLRNSNYSYTFDEYQHILKSTKEAEKLASFIQQPHTIFNEISDKKIVQSNNHTSICDVINEQTKQTHACLNLIETNKQQYKDFYLHLIGWRSFVVSFLSIFSSKYKNIKQQKAITLQQYDALKLFVLEANTFDSTIPFIETNVCKNIEELLPSLQTLQTKTNDFITVTSQFEPFFNYKKFQLQQGEKTKNILQIILDKNINPAEKAFTTYYFNQVILKNALENGFNNEVQQLFYKLQEIDQQLRHQLSERIHFIWNELQQTSIASADLKEKKYLYNQRKNKQFNAKNSLRQILQQDFDFFTTIFPVTMVNPNVGTSIFPLQENLFDYIIFDEASQLRLEDTYTSLLRGKTKIISGDKHQMPPSNFFGNEIIFWEENEDENTVEDFLAESKSLLEYAADANYKNTYLDYHYRSQHPNLIQFSNYAFYQSRLVPMPEVQPYQAIYYTNVNGIYANGINPTEADAVIDFIYNLKFTEDKIPSVGIATFNIYQRDLILEKLHDVAYTDKLKNEHLQTLLNHGLFVKNLENIQGDERDIMLLSTTFGKDEKGKFRQLFGPLSQEKGYQLLNVIITRAKQSLHVFTSIPETLFLSFEQELLEKGNTGKSIFYAYLSYANACAENNNSQLSFIKNTLIKNNHSFTKQQTNQTATLKQLIFEDIQAILGEQVQQNYSFGGFTIDIMLLKDGKPFLALDFENIKNYNSEVSYRIKLHQAQMLKNYQIETYFIWSFSWWKNYEQSLQELINHFHID
ncbi:MAG: DUF4011 domain-containing protein [Bacteroidetes bacterium]|nr:DUF4011 domain-containing protein [Bacteroidota bacterium]